MYYPCSENKDADQLRGYREADNREADLRLCFRPCKLLVFSRTGSHYFLFGAILSANIFILERFLINRVIRANFVVGTFEL